MINCILFKCLQLHRKSVNEVLQEWLRLILVWKEIKGIYIFDYVLCSFCGKTWLNNEFLNWYWQLNMRKFLTHYTIPPSNIKTRVHTQPVIRAKCILLRAEFFFRIFFLSGCKLSSLNNICNELKLVCQIFTWVFTDIALLMFLG